MPNSVLRLARVNAALDDEFRRAHLVKEDRWPDHLPIKGGQGAAHLKVANVTRARDGQGLDAVGVRLGTFGVLDRVPAHGGSFVGMALV